MCGIVGYIGHRDAYPIVLNGLKRLEYRGYDSAGIAIYDGTDLKFSKTKGKVADLEAKLESEVSTNGTIAIGHTRWATHGVPNDVNSHPHFSNSGDLVIIHNGIIENYQPLKTELMNRGFTFQSDTDTEVLVNLIEDVKTKEKVKLGKAVQIALNQTIGAYAIAVFDRNKPNEIVVARLGSPLAIGVGENEFFIASDASPFIEFTKEAIYLEDGEMAVVRTHKDMKIRKIHDDSLVDPYIQELQMNLEQIEKGGYDHFMLKEIYEQPQAIRDTFRGRMLVDQGLIKMAGIDDHIDKFLNARRILIVACGTSWHAGLVAEYIFEDLARIPVEVEYASEFRYRNPVIDKDDILIAISQSGETADTMAAIKMAKDKGAFVFGVCNVVGSSISREAHAGAYTHAGPEIGVASTKAFTTQITVLTLIALQLAKKKGKISTSDFHRYLQELDTIPEKVEKALGSNDHIEKIAAIYKDAPNCLYLGRGFNFPVALEGALKLKEISYIHAEGYPAAEMKHGPIALIDEQMPVVVIATRKGIMKRWSVIFRKLNLVAVR
ncbi:glucosamine-fructose-6-phosphate aminotransferase [Nonlabens ulvanivorans]|uniref:Glutamine--fructose-6-phosphate aminotransferase [isomerizing] n=1 Tax=Nonlabens ulvanivorans TaxID=906888 RepID=A0A090Q652_NONUL|nr:glucosamine-fructose-6-phosphate aminotransferase [Nonlabens ulvanivorans]